MTPEETLKLLPILFGILFTIVFANFAVSLAYFLQNRTNRLTRWMVAYWGTQIITLFAGAIFQGSTLQMCVPYSLNMFIFYFFREGMFGDHGQVPSYKRYLVLYFLICWPAAIVLENQFGVFLYTTLPLAIGLSAPMLEVVHLVFVKKQEEFQSLHHKWAAIIVLGVVIHNFNFSFFRDDISNVAWGTTVQVLIVTLFGIVISNFHNYALHKGENERLEKLVGERTADLEEKLVQVEQLQTEKERLFKIVLHDISNPISAVLGYLTLLEKPSLSLEEEKKREYIQRSSISANAVANIIRQVRALASGTEGGYDHISKKNNLKDVLSLVETIHTPLYQKKGVELSIINPNDNYEFYANRELFVHSVLGNLLSNSLKFSEPGSKVTVSHSVVGDSLCISVEDEGWGIKREMIGNLFDVNKSVSVGTDGELGSGYGLQILKNYMDKIDGRVRVESASRIEGAEKHGTSVFLELRLV